MPLWIAYAPYAVAGLAVLAYFLRRCTMLVMNCVTAFAYSWCVGRDYSLGNHGLMIMDLILTAVSALGAFTAWHYERGGYRA